MPARNTIEVRITARDNASAVIRGVGSHLQDMGKAAAIGLAALGAATAAVTAGIADLAVEAASFGGIREAFEGMAEAAGRDADEFLEALQRESAGMIDMETLMLKANLATQLVGDQFAEQLPQALGYLSKVASATGEDMGFLMDSLVRGVGRLSPMILDNLGIQVDLNAAYETYAASVGKSVDSLSKAEQQTALMNAVMAALAENTASMPDIFNQTDTRLARLQATFKDLRLEIGDRLQPVLDQFITWGEGLLGILRLLVLGDYTGILYEVFAIPEDSPIVALLLGIREGLQAIAAGVPVMDVFANLIADVQERAAAYGMTGLVEALQQLHGIVVNILKPIADWVSENIRLSDILIAIAIAIGSIVVPAILGIIAAAAPLIALFAAIVLLAAGVRKAWEEDLGGIRTFVEQTLIPAIQEIVRMFETGDFSRLPQIIQDVLEGLGTVLDNLIGQPIRDLIARLPDLMQQVVDFFWDNLAGPIGEALSSIRPEQFAAVAIGIGIIAAAFLVANLPSFIGAITAALATLLTTGMLPLIPIILVVGGILYAWSENLMGFRDRVTEFGDTLRRGITALGQLFFIIIFGMLSAVQWLINRINELKAAIDRAIQTLQTLLGMSPSGYQSYGTTGQSIDLGSSFNFLKEMLGLAGGGPAMGGRPYVVGERGPEVFVPGSSGTVVPNGQLGGSTYNFYFQGNGGPRDEREAEDSAYLVVGALRARGVEV